MEMIERDLVLEDRDAAGIKKWPADGPRHSPKIQELVHPFPVAARVSEWILPPRMSSSQSGRTGYC
jgi:hypothetical protein